MPSNPMTEYRDLITRRTQDLPEATQDAIDTMAWGTVLRYQSLAVLRSTWKSVGFRPPHAAGVATVSDMPGSLLVWSAATQDWREFEPKPERERGTVKFIWQPGQWESDVVEVEFSAFSGIPERPHWDYESRLPDYGAPNEPIFYQVTLVAGSLTADGCAVYCKSNFAAHSVNGRTAFFSWRTERTL